MKNRVLIFSTFIALSLIIVTLWPGKPTVKRPQEPEKPFPYFSENISFPNPKANIVLAATLSMPSKDGKYPAVILITGSGPQNRNEEIGGHKPFLVISDYLTKKGIAVLRYDDRGTSQSTGDFEASTSLDFAADVESAIAYLKTRKEINVNKIGLIGHSEGAMIAPMVASISDDVGFIVLLAGPGIPGDKLLIKQQELIERALGVQEAEIKKSTAITREVFAMVLKSQDTDTLNAQLKEYAKKELKDIPFPKHLVSMLPPGMTKEQFVAANIKRTSSRWFRFILGYNPVTTLQKVTCPVLALNGGKDLQVAAKDNLNAMESALKKGGNHQVTIKELPGLNHFFQECKTGSPSEYASIEQTFSPVALAEISTWILKQ